MAWKRDPHYQLVLDKRLGSDWKGDKPTAWSKGELKALVSRDDVSRDKVPDMRWHISVSHSSRVHNCVELVMASHEVRPVVVLVVGLAPKPWWIDVHAVVLDLLD